MNKNKREVIKAFVGENKEYNELYKEVFTPLLFHEEVPGWKVIEKEITNVDEADGGVAYEIIIQREEDGVFFGACYNDWDMNDLQSTFTQVFPKQKTITVYE